jgi:signal transduction histidine kinase
MQERAAQIGAKFTIDSAPGAGTSIEVVLGKRSDAEAGSAH